MGTLTQEQVDRLRMPGIPSITPEKSEDFIKILERHPEHKTGDMSAVWREWQELNGIEPDGSAVPVACLDEARQKVEEINDVKAQLAEARSRENL